MIRYDWVDIGAILLLGLTAVVALLAAFLLWRDGYKKGWRAARNKPPTCPQCGYNLSGLTHCRCPECGTEYSLDELWRLPAVTPQSFEKPDGETTAPVQEKKRPLQP